MAKLPMYTKFIPDAGSSKIRRAILSSESIASDLHRYQKDWKCSTLRLLTKSTAAVTLVRAAPRQISRIMASQ